MWTRRLSTKMGITQDEFIQVFIHALSDSTVIQKLQEAVCEPLRKEVVDLKKSMQEKDAKIASLEKRVSYLELQVDDLEQYSRRNSLRISGISESENEDVSKKVIDLVNDTLKVTPALTADQIDRVHRTGRHSAEKTRPILVKFTNYGARNQVIRSRGKLRDRNQNVQDQGHQKQTVFINEDLTKYRAELLYHARQCKKDKTIDDCWSWDGKILIKDKASKIIQVRSVEELMKVRN